VHSAKLAPSLRDGVGSAQCNRTHHLDASKGAGDSTFGAQTTQESPQRR